MGFMDMRQWITRLEKEGELRRITAEVDWDREIGAVEVLDQVEPQLGELAGEEGWIEARDEGLAKVSDHGG